MCEELINKEFFGKEELIKEIDKYFYNLMDNRFNYSTDKRRFIVKNFDLNTENFRVINVEKAYELYENKYGLYENKDVRSVILIYIECFKK